MMKRILLVGLTLLSATANVAVMAQEQQISLKELPGIHSGAFKVDTYIRAAGDFQAMGKDKACDTLLRLSNIRGGNTQAIVLCRMLFVRKPKGEFRRPGLGAPIFVGGTSVEDWPLEPIEMVDGIPFLMTRGYFLAGRPESAASCEGMH
jgi:hypothetical protein